MMPLEIPITQKKKPIIIVVVGGGLNKKVLMLKYDSFGVCEPGSYFPFWLATNAQELTAW